MKQIILFLLCIIAGLAGFFLVVENQEKIITLSTGIHEIPVLKEFRDNFQTGLQVVGREFGGKIQSFYEVADSSSVFEIKDKNTKKGQQVTTSPQWAWTYENILGKLEANMSQSYVQAAQKRALPYIEKYREAAMNDMRISGVPASITMAQALLESDCGLSRLAQKANNHFGIKCRHSSDLFADGIAEDDEFYYQNQFAYDCFQTKDDNIWDRFNMYQSVNLSYAHHSWLLTRGKRYNWMLQTYQVGKEYPCSEKWFGIPEAPYYAAWAVGLRYGKGTLRSGARPQVPTTGGYATSRTYPWKIIRLIETYELWRLDYEVIYQVRV